MSLLPDDNLAFYTIGLNNYFFASEWLWAFWGCSFEGGWVSCQVEHWPEPGRASVRCVPFQKGLVVLIQWMVVARCWQGCGAVSGFYSQSGDWPQLCPLVIGPTPQSPHANARSTVSPLTSLCGATQLNHIRTEPPDAQIATLCRSQNLVNVSIIKILTIGL